jgi:hypothetical protein
MTPDLFPRSTRPLSTWRSAAAAGLVLGLALTLGACSKPAPEPPAVVQPAAVSDSDVTAAVQSLLGGDAQTKPFNLAVATSQGEVSLTGTMDTQVQIDHALALTRATAGVRNVKDGLVLKPS